MANVNFFKQLIKKNLVNTFEKISSPLIKKETSESQSFKLQSLLSRAGINLNQVGALVIAQFFVVGFGMLIKVIQTRALSVEEFGVYSFFGTITGFLALIFRFGFYTSLKVIVANISDTIKIREYIGLGYIVAFCIGLFYSLCLALLSIWIDNWFDANIGSILLLIAPFCFVIPFKLFINEIGVGSNNIKAISIYEILGISLHLILLVIIWQLNIASTKVLILINVLSVLVATAASIAYLKPLFKNLKLNFSTLWNKNKSYGLHYYSGAIVNQTTFKLDEFFITYFVNVTQLGFYNLANMICAPMSLLSGILSKVTFKKMAKSNVIPKELFIINFSWLLLCVTLIYFLIEALVAFLFGPDYIEVAAYVTLLSAAHLFQGLYAPYSFLSAKSKGKEIRNVAIIEAFVNIVGNIILIPLYGVIGAIVSSILTRFIHYVFLHYYYKKLTSVERQQ